MLRIEYDDEAAKRGAGCRERYKIEVPTSGDEKDPVYDFFNKEKNLAQKLTEASLHTVLLCAEAGRLRRFPRAEDQPHCIP